MSSVAASIRQSGTRHADQGGVWNDLAAKSERVHVAIPTRAMNDVLDAHRTQLDDFVGAFRVQPDQTGAVFAIGESNRGTGTL